MNSIPPILIKKVNARIVPEEGHTVTNSTGSSVPGWRIALTVRATFANWKQAYIEKGWIL